MPLSVNCPLPSVTKPPGPLMAPEMVRGELDRVAKRGLPASKVTGPVQLLLPLEGKIAPATESGSARLIGPKSCRTALLETVVPPLVEPKD